MSYQIMSSDIEEFENITTKVDELENERFEAMSDGDDKDQNEEKFEAKEELLDERDSAIDRDDSSTEVEHIKLFREKVTIAAEYSKYHKNMNDERSPLSGSAVSEDYDSLVAKREQAEKTALASIDKHIETIQKALEIDEQIKSLEDGGDNGSAPGNDTGSGPSNDPAANTGSLLDDFADPNLEQPSHMDSDD